MLPMWVCCEIVGDNDFARNTFFLSLGQVFMICYCCLVGGPRTSITDIRPILLPVLCFML